MGIKVNMDEVEAWQGGGLLPPGRHVVEITSAGEGQSSGGHEQIEVEFTAIEGECVGGTLRDWLVVLPQTLGKVKSLFECAGVEIPAGEVDLPTSKLKGQKLTIVAREQQKYGAPEGEMQTKVVGYQEYEWRADVPAETEGLPVAAGGGASDADDDIPF